MFKRIGAWWQRRQQAQVVYRWMLCDALVKHVMLERQMLRERIEQDFGGAVRDDEQELRLVKIKRLGQVKVADLRAVGIPDYAIAAAATRVDERVLLGKFPQFARSGLFVEKETTIVRRRPVGSLKGIDFSEPDL